MKTLLCAALIVLSCGFAVGQQYKVLHTFEGAQAGDGAEPFSNLVLDREGNLYGTTRWGGSNLVDCSFYCGTVFKLSPNGDGTWTETILYDFCTDISNGVCLDGALPLGGLIFDRKGNLYGTTSAGGTQCLINFCGVVFELSPPSPPGTAWTETVLHSFCPNSTQVCPDGAEPLSDLTMDLSGNLYGTTSIGGSGHDHANGAGGTVFELSHGASGWTETVLYNFCTLGQGEVCPDGTLPEAGVTFDKLGNLYGTTKGGGNYYGFGTLYKLSPGANGWTETVLQTSKQSLATWPMGAVSIDALGNLYSTFSAGEQGSEFGGVFRLGPHGGGAEFSFDGNNGYEPTAGVLIDAKHEALYGTTSGGGYVPGTVFKMVAPAQLTVLYNFCAQPNCADGAGPFGSLIEDKFGNLYGTTEYGGDRTSCSPGGCGVVFEIVQSSPEEKSSRRPADWHAILPSED